MGMEYLTGREFRWETSVQGIRAKQVETLLTMIFHMSHQAGLLHLALIPLSYSSPGSRAYPG